MLVTHFSTDQIEFSEVMISIKISETGPVHRPVHRPVHGRLR